ncbi:uncharacterized protein LOC141615022 [Silene latifolia]|uniref:uncharacterized protein LOC141615022 n=1 Tax=Silene latifolia TaxID=37657 RepID=UPI003D7895B9
MYLIMIQYTLIKYCRHKKGTEVWYFFFLSTIAQVQVQATQVAQYIFNQSDRQPKKRVFLHCTHGHNRTGYMIVHYLMRTQQASTVTEAIQKFAKVRPPGIYKQDYIDSLYAFYHESKPDLITCPSTPEWKRSSDFDLNGEALPEDDDGVPYAPINV